MQKRERKGLNVRELVLFSMLGALMFCSKIIMEALPNIHLLGMFTIVFTIIYRKKALFPIYVYVFLLGIYGGFSYWWIANLYVWTILWAIVMLLPQKLMQKAPRILAVIIYCVICGLHGLLYGVMSAPVEALVHGFNLEQTLAYIGYGFYFDALHCIGNAISALLVIPLTKLLLRLEKNKNKKTGG